MYKSTMSCSFSFLFRAIKAISIAYLWCTDLKILLSYIFILLPLLQFSYFYNPLFSLLPAIFRYELKLGRHHEFAIIKFNIRKTLAQLLCMLFVIHQLRDNQSLQINIISDCLQINTCALNIKTSMMMILPIGSC